MRGFISILVASLVMLCMALPAIACEKSCLNRDGPVMSASIDTDAVLPALASVDNYIIYDLAQIVPATSLVVTGNETETVVAAVCSSCIEPEQRARHVIGGGTKALAESTIYDFGFERGSVLLSQGVRQLPS